VVFRRRFVYGQLRGGFVEEPEILLVVVHINIGAGRLFRRFVSRDAAFQEQFPAAAFPVPFQPSCQDGFGGVAAGGGDHRGQFLVPGGALGAEDYQDAVHIAVLEQQAEGCFVIADGGRPRQVQGIDRLGMGGKELCQSRLCGGSEGGQCAAGLRETMRRHETGPPGVADHG